MRPPGRPGDSGSRYTVLSMSRTLLSFAFMAAFMLLSLYGYFFVFGLKSSSTPTGPHLIGLLIVAPLATAIGLAAGSWVWGFLGKKFLRFTRQEIEPLVTPMLPIPLLVQYKNWYLNVLFGAKPGTNDSIQRVLHECSAAAITAHWDEQTTRRFDMTMARTEWWPHRRGTLRFLSEALTFEDWTVPYAEIDDAVVTLVQGIVPGYYLRIRANGQPYQFSILSMNASFFGRELPFPIRRASAKGFTWPYLLARLVPLFALLALFLWTRKK